MRLQLSKAFGVLSANTLEAGVAGRPAIFLTGVCVTKRLRLARPFSHSVSVRTYLHYAKPSLASESVTQP